jgi:hypothetical protein
VIVLDGETIYFPHLLGEDYRLHVGMIAAESLTAVSLQAPPWDLADAKNENAAQTLLRSPPRLPAAAPACPFSRILKVKI